MQFQNAVAACRNVLGLHSPSLTTPSVCEKHINRARTQPQFDDTRKNSLHKQFQKGQQKSEGSLFTEGCPPKAPSENYQLLSVPHELDTMLGKAFLLHYIIEDDLRCEDAEVFEAIEFDLSLPLSILKFKMSA